MIKKDNKPTNSEDINQINSKTFRERINQFQIHFGRFLWDLMGIGLISLGLLILVGLLGISSGTFLFAIVEFISTWVGWGIILVIGLLIFGGILSLRVKRNNIDINLNAILWLELSCFFSLAVLSIIGGNSLLNLESGWWGGRVGWSIVRLSQNVFGTLIGNIIIIAVWIFSIISIINGWDVIEDWLKFHSKEHREITQVEERNEGNQQKTEEYFC